MISDLLPKVNAKNHVIKPTWLHEMATQEQSIFFALPKKGNPTIKLLMVIYHYRDLSVIGKTCAINLYTAKSRILLISLNEAYVVKA